MQSSLFHGSLYFSFLLEHLKKCSSLFLLHHLKKFSFAWKFLPILEVGRPLLWCIWLCVFSSDAASWLIHPPPQTSRPCEQCSGWEWGADSVRSVPFSSERCSQSSTSLAETEHHLFLQPSHMAFIVKRGLNDHLYKMLLSSHVEYVKPLGKWPFFIRLIMPKKNVPFLWLKTAV